MKPVQPSWIRNCVLEPVWELVLLLVIILIALFIPLIVRAETAVIVDIHGEVVECFADGQTFPPRADGNCHREDVKVAPCLAKMEAAMRANEPYLHGEPFLFTSTNAVYCTPHSSCELEQRIAELKLLREHEEKKWAAWQQWADVKKECWRK